MGKNRLSFWTDIWLKRRWFDEFKSAVAQDKDYV